MIPKKKVRIQSEKYLIRTIGTDDASDRWASWMSDPEAMYMLNMPARNWKKVDVVNYIKAFDQRSSLLLGILKNRAARISGYSQSISIMCRANFSSICLLASPHIETGTLLRASSCRFENISLRRLG